MSDRIAYRYIDSHAHLDFPDFDKDRDALMKDIFNSGCVAVVNPGANIATSHAAIELAKKYDRVYPAVGIHPHEAIQYLGAGNDAMDMLYRDIETLDKLASMPEVVAIGECGLDYYRFDKTNAATSKIIALQKELFQLQLTIAQKRGKPIILHVRDAYEDVLEVLDIQEYSSKGVAHCYEGSWPVTEVLLSRGFSLGFTANITYAKKESIHEVIKKVSLERILLETDSPYLPPQGRRGKRNDSRSVIDVGKKIAELHATPEEEVFRQTTNNTTTLFSLPVL